MDAHTHLALTANLSQYLFKYTRSCTPQWGLVCRAETLECYTIVPVTQLQKVFLFHLLVFVFAQPLLKITFYALVINVSQFFLSCLSALTE